MSTPDWWLSVEADIHQLMDGFTDKLKQKLDVSTKHILGRKNPFLFCVRAGNDPYELVKMVVDAYLSSSEETMFGNILEEIAISVCSHAKGGSKSSAEGIDIEYDKNNERTIIQVKSGKNWGNSSQRKKLIDNFNSAKKRLRTTGLNVRCIEGICYGASQTKDYGTHLALVGGHFWLDISEWENTHYQVVNALEVHASNGLTNAKDDAGEKMLEYLNDNNVIYENQLDWNKLSRLLFQP